MQAPEMRTGEISAAGCAMPRLAVFFVCRERGDPDRHLGFAPGQKICITAKVVSSLWMPPEKSSIAPRIEQTEAFADSVARH